MAKGKSGRKENRQPSGQATEPGGVQKTVAKTHNTTPDTQNKTTPDTQNKTTPDTQNKTTPDTQKVTRARTDDKQFLTKSYVVQTPALYGRVAGLEIKPAMKAVSAVAAEPKPQRQFKKRTIASNEFRYREDDTYDLDIDDDAVETKDFMYLVNNAGGSTTHFQFADEKAWEESLHQEMSNSDGDTHPSSFLDLNLDRLASELSGSHISKISRLDNLPTECRYCVEDLLTDDCETTESLVLEHEEQNASPVTPTNHFEWTLNGISEFETFIFGDRSSQLKTAADVEKCTATDRKVISSDLANDTRGSSVASVEAVQVNDRSSCSSDSMDELLTRDNSYGNTVPHTSEDRSILDDLLALPQASTSERSSDQSQSSEVISVGQSRSSEDILADQSQNFNVLTSQSQSNNMSVGDDDPLDELLALSNEVVTTEPHKSGSLKADASSNRSYGNDEDDLDILLQLTETSKESELAATSTSGFGDPKANEIDDWLTDMLNKPI